MSGGDKVGGSYLNPCGIIGLGTWGSHVAAGVRRSLQERSPLLSRACPVLPLAPDTPSAADQIRSHLRSTRLAEVIRTMEREGLMLLDPVLPPPTCLYLIASLQEADGASRLQWAAAEAVAAASDLQISLGLVALLDLGPEGRLPEGWWPGGMAPCPLYVTQPITSQGLLLSEEEYAAAITEALVALVQPGGSEVLAGGRGQVGTLGIAWLTWSPADLCRVLARRLSREAVLHALTRPPDPAARATIPLTEVWHAQSHEQRTAALLRGLPFHALPSPEGTTALVRSHRPEGAAVRSRNPLQYLKRCAAVLDRRLERWEQVLVRNTALQADREARLLEEAALTCAGPPTLGLLLERLTDEADARSAAATAVTAAVSPLPQTGPALQRLERALSLPYPLDVSMVAGVAAAVVLLVGWLGGSSWQALLGWVVLLAAVPIAHTVWRSRKVTRTTEAAAMVIAARGEALAAGAVQDRMSLLDRSLHKHCQALSAELCLASHRLQEACRSDQEAEQSASPGALSFPLLGASAVETLCRNLQAQVPALAENLSNQGGFKHWREPSDLLEQCRGLTEAFLMQQLDTPDAAQLASRAYDGGLPDRLREAIDSLLAWSHPLLAPSHSLPEGRRWLFWPEGMPCPPVPNEVGLLLSARSSAAVLTVIDWLPPDLDLHPRKRTGAVSG